MFPEAWIMPLWMFAVADQPEAQLRLAKSPTHKESVTRARTAPQDGPTGPRFPHDGDVDKDVFVSGCIAAGEHAPESLGRPPQSAEKLVEPDAGVSSRQGQTQKKTTRHAAHRGNVAHRSGQAFPTHGISRMLVAKEV
jgi:hypothetical protein